jgi:hypothetical protein
VFFNQLLDTIYLCAIETLVTLKTNWAKPELSFVRIGFNMYVGWLISIAGIAEKTIWPNSQKSRHLRIIITGSKS